MVGLPADYPIEQTEILEFYPPEQRAFAADVIAKAMVEQGRWAGETFFRHWQTGEAIPVSDEQFTIRDAGGTRVLGVATITRNISEARRITDQLRESEERFRVAATAQRAVKHYLSSRWLEETDRLLRQH